MEKVINIVSGFSGTLKTTTIKSIKSDLVLLSPVKYLSNLCRDYFNNCNLTPVHSYLSQYYALMMNENRFNIDNIVIERGLWDYLYFYDLLKDKLFTNDSIKSVDDVNYKMLFELFIQLVPEHKLNVIVLENHSDELINTVISGGEKNRMNIYKSIDEYKKLQDKYLGFIYDIISKLGIKNIDKRIITDEYFRRIRDSKC